MDSMLLRKKFKILETKFFFEDGLLMAINTSQFISKPFSPKKLPNGNMRIQKAKMQLSQVKDQVVEKEILVE